MIGHAPPGFEMNLKAMGSAVMVREFCLHPVRVCVTVEVGIGICSVRRDIVRTSLNVSTSSVLRVRAW